MTNVKQLIEPASVLWGHLFEDQKGGGVRKFEKGVAEAFHPSTFSNVW